MLFGIHALAFLLVRMLFQYGGKECDGTFRESVKDSVFKMSQLFEEKYDSFYVLRPYFPVDSLGQLEMSDGLKEFLESRLMFDNAFIILLSEASTLKRILKFL